MDSRSCTGWTGLAVIFSRRGKGIQLRGVCGMGKDFVRFPQEILHVKRLLHERDIFVCCDDAQFVICVSRHVEHPDFWMYGLEADYEIRATHLGHDHVGQEQINALGILLCSTDRIGAILTDQYSIATCLQTLNYQVPKRRLVLNHKNCPRALPGCISPWSRG